MKKIYKDVLKERYEDEPETFEDFLNEKVSEYIDKTSGEYLSLEAFLLQWGAFELPNEEHYEFYIIRYLKQLANEFLRAKSANKAALAYDMLTTKTEGSKRQTINISFESAIEELKEEED